MKVMIKKKWEMQKLIMFIQQLLLPVISVYLLYRRDWNTMPPAWVFSISLDIFGMIICLFLFMSVVKDRNDVAFRTGCFSYLISICDLELFLSLCCWIVDEIPSLRTINMLSNTASQALSAIMLCIVWQYLVAVADIDSPRLNLLSKFFSYCALVSLGLTIGNYFKHYYFYVDETGRYFRADYFLICYFYFALMLIAVIGIVLFMEVSASKKRALLTFATMPLLAAIIQSISFGIDLIYPAFLCSLLLIYCNVFAEQNHELTKNKLKAMSAENRLLLEQQKYERIETELNMATQIQTKLLPAVFPPFPDLTQLDLYSTMHPAKEVGGDFYDFFLLDEDHICLVIADVSGKGVPAALYMMIAKTLIKTALKQGVSPATCLSLVNKQFCDTSVENEMFVTVWAGCLELSTGRLTCSNAGHEYPAIRRAGGQFELYKDKHSFVVGGIENIRYKEYDITLLPGDTIFLYTDGVTEANDEDHTFFGTSRMLDALNAKPNSTSQELIEYLLKEVQEFTGTEEQFDDITMMALRIKES